jgi:hypothetical protein
MSSIQEPVTPEPIKPEVQQIVRHDEVEPVIQEEVGKVVAKKCCNTMKEDVHIAFKCCAYTWCISLNGIECCCLTVSKVCGFISDIAMCCNKALEQIDCDTH